MIKLDAYEGVSVEALFIRYPCADKSLRRMRYMKK
jgi:hypothetical protein